MAHIEICKHIQNNIKKLCCTEIDEIFKLIHKNNSKYTQNNNGIFINLNWVDEPILKQINDYINFCLKSQTEISKYEIMKNIINDTIINKEQIDDDEKIDCAMQINTSNLNANVIKQPRVSSSMKFYILKKKFLKKATNTIIFENNLVHEAYYIH